MKPSRKLFIAEIAIASIISVIVLSLPSCSKEVADPALVSQNRVQ